MRFSVLRARRSTSSSAARDFARVAAGAQCVEARDLGAFDFGIDAQRGDRPLFVRLKAVHADYHLLAALDGLLIFVRGFLNFLLDVARFDGAKHPAHGVDLRDVFLRACFDFVG